MVTQGVKDLQRPVEESRRNTQRLRRVVDKLATEFEIVRRERRATQRDDWDALELETFDSYAHIILEFGEIIAGFIRGDNRSLNPDSGSDLDPEQRPTCNAQCSTFKQEGPTPVIRSRPCHRLI